VEYSASVSGHPPNEGRRPSFSSQDPLQLDSPHVLTSDGVDRPHRGLLQRSPSSLVEGKVASNKSKLSLLFGSRSSENSDSLSPGEEGPSVDHQSVPTSVLRPLWFQSPEVCDLEVQTDVSNLGYGIWFEGFLHQGLWYSTTAHLHINGLETTALWHFLAFILPKSSKQRNILWRVDNTTALAYVKKEIQS
jgi:hypothetical protein